MQVAFSDLGTEARNSNAYTAQTDSRGRAVNSNPTQDAQLIAQHQQRQTQLQASADELTRTWNSKQQPSFLYQGHFTDLGQLLALSKTRALRSSAIASVVRVTASISSLMSLLPSPRAWPLFPGLEPPRAAGLLLPTRALRLQLHVLVLVPQLPMEPLGSSTVNVRSFLARLATVRTAMLVLPTDRYLVPSSRHLASQSPTRPLASWSPARALVGPSLPRLFSNLPLTLLTRRFVTLPPTPSPSTLNSLPPSPPWISVSRARLTSSTRPSAPTGSSC